MPTSSDVVRCTVRDGVVWMVLDKKRVRIPSHLLQKSQVLMNALSSVVDRPTAIRFNLGVPKEWLQAWEAHCCRKEPRLSNARIQDLVHCLMVCVSLWIEDLVSLTTALSPVRPYCDCFDSEGCQNSLSSTSTFHTDSLFDSFSCLFLFELFTPS
jgi:hypothetical protein